MKLKLLLKLNEISK